MIAGELNLNFSVSFLCHREQLSTLLTKIWDIAHAIIGRFQKISISIPRTTYRISEGEGGSLNWHSEGMGVFTIGNPKAWGCFTSGISRVERVE